VWGCEGETKLPRGTVQENENGEDFIYMNCPVRFIPDSVYAWWMLYSDLKQFPSVPVPPLENRSYRFTAASNYYNSKYQEYCNDVRRK
jgi:hypothetical protein